MLHSEGKKEPLHGPAQCAQSAQAFGICWLPNVHSLGPFDNRLLLAGSFKFGTNNDLFGHMIFSPFPFHYLLGFIHLFFFLYELTP